MNYSKYEECQCPNGYPPCSYCTETTECDWCKNRFDNEDIITDPFGDFICKDCVNKEFSE